MNENKRIGVASDTRAAVLLCLGAVLMGLGWTQAVGAAEEKGQSGAYVGAYSAVITEALLKAQPAWRERALVDDLQVTALYAQCAGEAVCLLAYDVCEMTRREIPPLKNAVARALEMRPERVHVFCSHTHSSSMDDTQHDAETLAAISVAAARHAKEHTARVDAVGFLRVDTGRRFNINRRTTRGELGTWCLMQSRGCTDDGEIVDGTQWVRDKLVAYGATRDEVATVSGPCAATRENDPDLELVLFPKVDGGYAAGLVRFTAHPVICSAGYWKPNLGRDYPGPLCDRLAEKFGCPILFLQGPCGDHRPRHRQVGLAERDRIGQGLAEALIARTEQISTFPFDRLKHQSRSVRCPLRQTVPTSQKEAIRLARQASRRLGQMPQGAETLRRRKDLAELRSFYQNAARVLAGRSYLTREEALDRRAALTVSHIAFGRVHLLNFPGELFSTVTQGLEEAAEGPTVVTSFADGVAGYLMPQDDIVQGGYESTWALFTPESIAALRITALELLHAAD